MEATSRTVSADEKYREWVLELNEGCSKPESQQLAEANEAVCDWFWGVHDTLLATVIYQKPIQSFAIYKI